MTLKKRLLLVFVPLSILPFLLLLGLQLLLTRGYLVSSQQQLVTLDREVSVQEFNRRFQQFQQAQLDSVPFFRDQLVARVALRYQGQDPDNKGMIAFDPQGLWLYPKALNGRDRFNASELAQLQPLLTQGEVQSLSGWLLAQPGQRFSVSGFVHSESGVTLLFYHNQQQALSPLNQSTWYSLSIGLVVLLVAIGIIVLAAKRISDPMMQLSRVMTEFGEGKTHLRAEAEQQGEVGVLAHEFNQMAERLQSFTLILETKIDERTQQLQAKLEELRATQQQLVQAEKLAALGAMVAGIAHELNTPIGNAVTVASSLIDSKARFDQLLQGGLTRSALDSLLFDVEEGSEIIERNLSRAVELIKSFKQLAVDQTSDQRREFYLHDLFKEVMLSMQPNLKNKPWQLNISCDQQLKLNSFPGAMGQVLINLINNAIVHGFSGKHQGQIQIQAQPIDQDWLQLEIADDGLGIAKEHMQRIFEPFFTTKLGQGGSGLGLHICFTLINGLLGGQIDVQSEPEQGTRFVLRLPMVAPAAKASHKG